MTIHCVFRLVDLRQTKTNIISGPFYTYGPIVEYISPAEMLRFYDMSVCLSVTNLLFALGLY